MESMPVEQKNVSEQGQPGDSAAMQTPASGTPPAMTFQHATLFDVATDSPRVLDRRESELSDSFDADMHRAVSDAAGAIGGAETVGQPAPDTLAPHSTPPAPPVVPAPPPLGLRPVEAGTQPEAGRDPAADPISFMLSPRLRATPTPPASSSAASVSRSTSERSVTAEKTPRSSDSHADAAKSGGDAMAPEAVAMLTGGDGSGAARRVDAVSLARIALATACVVWLIVVAACSIAALSVGSAQRRAGCGSDLNNGLIALGCVGIIGAAVIAMSAVWRRFTSRGWPAPVLHTDSWTLDQAMASPSTLATCLICGTVHTLTLTVVTALLAVHASGGVAETCASASLIPAAAILVTVSWVAYLPLSVAACAWAVAMDDAGLRLGAAERGKTALRGFKVRPILDAHTGVRTPVSGYVQQGGRPSSVAAPHTHTYTHTAGRRDKGAALAYGSGRPAYALGRGTEILPADKEGGHDEQGGKAEAGASDAVLLVL